MVDYDLDRLYECYVRFMEDGRNVVLQTLEGNEELQNYFLSNHENFSKVEFQRALKRLNQKRRTQFTRMIIMGYNLACLVSKPIISETIEAHCEDYPFQE